MAQWKPKTDKKAETIGKVAPDRKDSSQYTAALGMALGAPEDQRNLAFMLSRDSITGMVRQKRPEDLAEYLGLTEFIGFLIDTKLPLDARSEIRFTGLAFKGGNDKHHRLVAREYIGVYTLKPNLANLHDNVRAFLKGEDNWISELSLDRAMTGSTSIVKLDDAIKKSSLTPAEASRDEPEGALTARTGPTSDVDSHGYFRGAWGLWRVGLLPAAAEHEWIWRGVDGPLRGQHDWPSGQVSDRCHAQCMCWSRPSCSPRLRWAHESLTPSSFADGVWRCSPPHPRPGGSRHGIRGCRLQCEVQSAQWSTLDRVIEVQQVAHTMTKSMKAISAGAFIPRGGGALENEEADTPVPGPKVLPKRKAMPMGKRPAAKPRPWSALQKSASCRIWHPAFWIRTKWTSCWSKSWAISSMTRASCWIFRDLQSLFCWMSWTKMPLLPARPPRVD